MVCNQDFLEGFCFGMFLTVGIGYIIDLVSREVKARRGGKAEYEAKYEGQTLLGEYY